MKITLTVDDRVVFELDSDPDRVKAITAAASAAADCVAAIGDRLQESVDKIYDAFVDSIVE